MAAPLHGMELQRQPRRPSLLLAALQTLLLILFFYCFSITLTFYNKKYITIYPFPLSITVLHLMSKFCVAWLCRIAWQRLSGHSRLELAWQPYKLRVAPAGIASSLDIGLSNWSFEFITVSLYTMAKSSSIVFILVFAIFFKLEEKRWSLVAVIGLVASGLFLFTYRSTQFHLGGFLLVLGASFLSGVRWTTAQMLTQRQELGLSNPIDMIYHVQPWMLAALLPLALAFEGLEIGTTSAMFRAESALVAWRTFCTLMVGAGLAFALECSEYLLLCKTSSLALSVSGIFKELCTICLASRINGDIISPVNWMGMFVCLSGIGLHCATRARRATEEPGATFACKQSGNWERLVESNAGEEDEEDEANRARRRISSESTAD